MTDDKPIPKNEVEKELDKVPQDAELKKLSDKAAAEKLKKEIEREKREMQKLIKTEGWKIFWDVIEQMKEKNDNFLASLPQQAHFGMYGQGVKHVLTEVTKFVELKTKTDAKSKS